MPKQATKKLKYYLAGPMTGYPQFNFPLFDAAARDLRGRGMTLVSPAELDGPKIRKIALASKTGKLDKKGKIAKQSWGDLLSRDVKIVADEVQGIVLLPHWYLSKGARLEAFVGLLCKHEFELYLGDGRLEKLSSVDVLGKIYAHTDDSYE